MKRAAIVASAVAAIAVAAMVFKKEAGVANWALVGPEIKEPFHAEDLLFEDAMGLMMGDREPPGIPKGALITEVMAHYEAIILRLAPGGTEWRQVYSGRGTVFRASKAGGGAIYALGETFHRDGGRVPFILRSLDMGATWQSLPPPPQGLVGIRFAPEGRGWSWTKQAVFATEDDGRTWREVVRLSKETLEQGELEPVIGPQGVIWVPDGIRVLRVAGEEKAEFRLPAGTKPYWLAPAPDGSVWLVSLLEEVPRIYRLAAGRDPELLSEMKMSNYLPERLHVGRDVALLSGCELGGGVRAPVYFMLVSRDGGRTWTKELPAIKATLTPIYFETDEIVWAYANFGRIQRRSLR